jgi:hypothetical protein
MIRVFFVIHFFFAFFSYNHIICKEKLTNIMKIKRRKFQENFVFFFVVVVELAADVFSFFLDNM